MWTKKSSESGGRWCVLTTVPTTADIETVFVPLGLSACPPNCKMSTPPQALALHQHPYCFRIKCQLLRMVIWSSHNLVLVHIFNTIFPMYSYFGPNSLSPSHVSLFVCCTPHLARPLAFLFQENPFSFSQALLRCPNLEKEAFSKFPRQSYPTHSQILRYSVVFQLESLSCCACCVSPSASTRCTPNLRHLVDSTSKHPNPITMSGP